MPVFEFNDGSNDSEFSVATGAVSFADNNTVTSANFTLSINDPGATTLNTVQYRPGDGDGRLRIDAGFGDTAPDLYTLTAVDTANPVNTKFGGNTAGKVVLNITSIISPSVSPFQIQFDGTKADTTITVNGTGKVSVDTATFGHINKIVFTSSPNNDFLFQLSSIDANMVCYLEGTGIATPQGRVAVETLKPGDRILTADGRETTVKWLGELPVNARLMHPAKVNPIRITAGALGDGLPTRDLLLSADHAIAIDGLLINAGALVNGETIYQVRDMPLEGFTYYHIETEGGHELILAEGVAAESFIDYADTDSFVNAHERENTAPIPEMDLPRISTARLVPEGIRTRLRPHADERAVAA